MPDDDHTDSAARLAACEAELAETRARLAAVIERSSQFEQDCQRSLNLIGDYIFAYRLLPNGKLEQIWASAPAGQLSGYTPAQLEERGSWLSLIHPGDHPAVYGALRRLARGVPVEVELRLMQAGGTLRWIRVVAEPSGIESDGLTRQIRGAARDISLEKRLQDEQTRFITNAMHELSHPVSSILLRLHLMRKQPDRLVAHLDALQPVTERIRRMIEDLRSLFYLQRGVATLDREPIALQDLVQQVVQTCRTNLARDVRLNTTLAQTPILVYGDVKWLAHALDNLFASAAAVTPAGQTVQIEVLRPQGLDHGLVHILFQGSQLDPDHPSLLFHPFHQPSEGDITHTGLELAIAREIVRLHGGELVATTVQDDQTAFILRLPLWTEPPGGGLLRAPEP